MLKLGVILVDLLGIDQENKYMEKLDEYMKSHPSSSVVLLYVMDVKNKILNCDRQFFEKLLRSPWMELSQRLCLLVNKCDLGGSGNCANLDEEARDYRQLLSDIKTEASNYCTPKFMDLSVSDRKKKHPEAFAKVESSGDGSPARSSKPSA